MLLVEHLKLYFEYTNKYIISLVGGRRRSASVGKRLYYSNMNTKSLSRLASPSSKVVAIVLGGVAAGVVGSSYTTNNNTDNESDVDVAANNASHLVQSSRKDTISIAKNKIQYPTPQIMISPHPVHRTTIAKTNKHSNVNPTPLMILATSDASAERSASLAAATRIEKAKLKTPRSLSGSGFRSKSFPTARSLSGQKKNKEEDDDNEVDDYPGSQVPSPPKIKEEEEDSYPAFTPYHHSLLRKYLTPQVWSKLSHLTTSYGTSIEDIIRAGLALPIGANPPRRVGVLVGDAECYNVFSGLLDPIISEYHGLNGRFEEWSDPELPEQGYFQPKVPEHITKPKPTLQDKNDDANYGVMKSNGADEDGFDDSSFLLDEEGVEYLALPSSVPSTTENGTPTTSNLAQTPSRRNVETIASKAKVALRRHSTIINNPRLVTNKQVDPEGKYVLSTRIRVARSLDGIKFPPTMSRSERRKVERLIKDCTKNFQGANLAHGSYLPVLSMSNDQNLDLIERHILFDNPNEWTIASGLGRDWPDGRALYANVTNLQTQTPDFMIWVNEEDHLRIMCLRNGGDIQGVFITLMNGIRELERELTIRGWHFAYDPRLGFLTSCPTNVGTSMRASVHVRLTNLGRLPGFFELVERLKLEVRGKYGETDRHYTGVFDISNAERLGKSEVHLINVMVEGVAKLIELERRCEAGQEIDLTQILGYDDLNGYRRAN